MSKPTLAEKINEIIQALNLNEARIDRIEAMLEELGTSKVPTLSVTESQSRTKDRH